MGVSMRVAGRILTGYLERHASAINLTAGQLSVLGMVARYPDFPQNAYSEILVLNVATLCRYALALEKEGYVTRTRSEVDSRQVRLNPTPKRVRGVPRYWAAFGHRSGWDRRNAPKDAKCIGRPDTHFS